MKILIAVDGSPFSDIVINSVAERPWPPESEVRIISVAEMPASASFRDAVESTYVKEFENSLRAHAEGVANRAISKLQENRTQILPISKTVVVDSPKDAIIDEAERWGADLIMVGSHGYRGYKRFLLGSVSQGVVALAKCSVEIVRAPRIKEDET